MVLSSSLLLAEKNGDDLSGSIQRNFRKLNSNTGIPNFSLAEFILRNRLHFLRQDGDMGVVRTWCLSFFLLLET